VSKELNHFAAILQHYAGVWFLWSKKNVIFFQKEKGNTLTLLIIFIVKSLQKEQNSTNLLLWPQSTGINMQLPQSESTPRGLMLVNGLILLLVFSTNCFSYSVVSIKQTGGNQGTGG
jgi:hypothetical protein